MNAIWLDVVDSLIIFCHALNMNENISVSAESHYAYIELELWQFVSKMMRYMNEV